MRPCKVNIVLIDIYSRKFKIFSKFQKFTVNASNRKAIPEKFHPVLKLSNFEPDQLLFTYNGGTDLHLQIKL